jgi:hypothetical protein
MEMEMDIGLCFGESVFGLGIGIEKGIKIEIGIGIGLSACLLSCLVLLFFKATCVFGRCVGHLHFI